MTPSRRPRRAAPKGRSTPAGEHVAVMLAEVLQWLDPRPGNIALDCTLGFGGHARALAERIGPEGHLIGLDLDPEGLDRARSVLSTALGRVSIDCANFASAHQVLAAMGIQGADMVLADLGMSSMQVDDQERGFSYVRDGPLDMRMDRSRGRTAAQLLATISQEDLAMALHQIGDEPHANDIARAIVEHQKQAPLERTTQLADLIARTVSSSADGSSKWRLRVSAGRWKSHPAARTFQTLRILVNRELANLEHLLRILPDILLPGGRAAMITFHSGEDRLVKSSFRDGLASGRYQAVADDPIRPSDSEKLANPRARSAKLRWAVGAG
jgi:16S rRNA (cytosine1402-N4)-methyltransferase